MGRLAFLAALCGFLGIGQAWGMNYDLVPMDDGRCTACPLAIMARGTIHRDDAERLIAVLHGTGRQGAAPGTLIVSSPGGDLVGALALGLVVRRFGLRTVVGSVAPGNYGAMLTPGVCGSACIFVLMAGLKRQVVPGSLVAVHAPKVMLVSENGSFVLGGTLAQAAIRGAEPIMRSYARLMGVDPALIALANRVPNETRMMLTHSDLWRYRLISGGSVVAPARRGLRRWR